MDEQLDVIPFEFSEMFIDSFKLGAKMMAEVFRSEYEEGDRKKQTL